MFINQPCINLLCREELFDERLEIYLIEIVGFFLNYTVYNFLENCTLNSQIFSNFKIELNAINLG